MARYLLIEEALAEEDRERAAERRRTRELSLLRDPPDGEFLNIFRVTRELFEDLCQEVVPLLPPKLNSRGIDPTIKILIALKFYGRGDYQGGVGRDNSVPMSQKTVSRCLREVTQALNDLELVCRHIRFPQNRQERSAIKTGFYDKFRIPGICGAIDCTHVAIIRPKDNEERFFNRKHFHSLNVQMICDAVHRILNVDASYGGATHDSFIWQYCDIRENLESICSTGETAMLLGDSGYPLREYLMTPVDGAIEHSREGRYNFMQKKARSIIERTFGILKGRWRCLLSARQLHYHPEMAGKITIACSVLHNMCIAAHLEPIELAAEEAANEAETQRGAATGAPVSSATEALRRGREARARLILTLIRD